MKKLSWVLLLTLVIVMATAGSAFANYGPHGGYATDTDACAGCHRAHTSFSTLGWKGLDGIDHASALLISNAATMKEFCYACHGDAAPGASTNVASGVFDGGPTTGNGAVPDNVTTYAKSYSVPGAMLNGGGFDRMTGAGGSTSGNIISSHLMNGEVLGSPVADQIIKWGNASLAPMSKFTCTDCHDPHGSSNYRLLKDDVGGDKTNFVVSNEENFPTGGFSRGPAGALEIAQYVPNYTSSYIAAGPASEGMAQWCAGCHTVYGAQDGGLGGAATTYDYSAGTPAGTFPPGAEVFHRHPIGVTLAQGQGGARALNVELVDDPGLPLEMGLGTVANPQLAKPWDSSGQLSCLTCHFAHGSSATATGWAVASIDVNGYPTRVTLSGTQENLGHGSVADKQGVNPNFSESMLRYPNRGVCERCHNK